jgi:hypothetical protein
MIIPAGLARVPWMESRPKPDHARAEPRPIKRVPCCDWAGPKVPCLRPIHFESTFGQLYTDHACPFIPDLPSSMLPLASLGRSLTLAAPPRLLPIRHPPLLPQGNAIFLPFMLRFLKCSNPRLSEIDMAI